MRSHFGLPTPHVAPSPPWRLCIYNQIHVFQPKQPTTEDVIDFIGAIFNGRVAKRNVIQVNDISEERDVINWKLLPQNQPMQNCMSGVIPSFVKGSACICMFCLNPSPTRNATIPQTLSDVRFCGLYNGLLYN